MLSHFKNFNKKSTKYITAGLYTYIVSQNHKTNMFRFVYLFIYLLLHLIFVCMEYRITDKLKFVQIR